MQPVGTVRGLVEVIDADRGFEAVTRVLPERAHLVGRVDQMTPFGVDTIGVAVVPAVQFVSAAQYAQAHHVCPFAQGNARPSVEAVVIKLALGAVAAAVDVGSGIKTKRRLDLVVDFAAECEPQIVVGRLNVGRGQGKDHTGTENGRRYL